MHWAKASAAARNSDGDLDSEPVHVKRMRSLHRAHCDRPDRLPAIRKQANHTPRRNDHTTCASTRALSMTGEKV